ncbi:MAG: hypothetical protein SVP26_08955 [Chloroflexota bacterium]|nr:hypothetical protein [Chloroflexota bacterium]
MQLDLLLTADYANVTADGKLNVMGIFNRIYSSAFPASHAEMYLVANLSADPSEYGMRRKLVAKLMDEDGGLVAQLLEREIEVPQAKEGRPAEIRQILRLVGLLFPRPGTYQFSMLVDNDLKGSRAIRVIRTSKERAG